MVRQYLLADQLSVQIIDSYVHFLTKNSTVVQELVAVSHCER